jgi:hypothetical protein
MHCSKHNLCAVVAASLLVSGTVLAGTDDLVTGTIVAVDTSSHTLTLKLDDGTTSTTPVEGTALAEFGHLKPGEMVSARFRDTPKGDHEAITAVTIYKTVKVFEGR